jgi:hypothetical protein
MQLHAACGGEAGVTRGLEAELGAVAPPHHYLFHGELVLHVQSFPV